MNTENKFLPTENKFLPTTYWEDRAAQTDGCLLRLIGVMGKNFPALQPELTALLNEWNRIIDEMDEEYIAKEKITVGEGQIVS